LPWRSLKGTPSSSYRNGKTAATIIAALKDQTFGTGSVLQLAFIVANAAVPSDVYVSEASKLNGAVSGAGPFME